MKRWIKWLVAAPVLVWIAAGAGRGQHGDGPGLERSAALGLAAKVRLRPVLMTTLAMIFGRAPLAFAPTDCYRDDLAQWFRRKFSGKAPAAGTDQPDDLRQDGSVRAV